MQRVLERPREQRRGEVDRDELGFSYSLVRPALPAFVSICCSGGIALKPRHLNGALFSLLQGRILPGAFFAVWTGVSAIGFLHAASAQQFALPIAMEFTLVAAWSIIDADFYVEEERPHAAS